MKLLQKKPFRPAASLFPQSVSVSAGIRPPMHWYKSALLKALEASDGERHIHAFLKQKPQLMVTGFNWAWNHIFLVSEFQLGTRLRADFVLFGGYSGGWYVQFIELEPVKARLYLKDGTPSKELRTAMRQLSDWRKYAIDNQQSLRKELSHAMVSKNLYRAHLRPIHLYLEKEIRDPKNIIEWHYQIVIGRRGRLSEDEQERRSRPDLADCNIATYDRLVDAANKLDSAHREILQGRRQYAMRRERTERSSL